LVTGHYVQKIITNGKSELHKGLDLNKDQSYFLFATTKQQLDFLQFPLGGMTKEQTRLEAKRFGLITADKPDSQDICFVPNGSYVDLIKKMRPDALQDGSIMHIDGYEVGRHQGIAGYTIGQRRGLKISSPEALYVIRIDPNKNTIYVGPEKALNANSLIINDINWLAEDSIPKDGLEVEVKIRSAHRGSMAKIYNIDNNSILVKLLNYEKAITPGQACVIYDGTRVLGGGWIVKEENLSNL
jgi:tRNA-specific 2-thiouridylase